jgi:hypothetical protein
MIKTFLKELYLTFSSQPTLLSSKRIERCLTFLSMLFMTYVYVYKNIDKMDSTSFMIVIGGWMTYGAYNTAILAKQNQSTNVTTNSTGEEPPQK